MKKGLKILLSLIGCLLIIIAISNVKASDENYNKFKDLVDPDDIYCVGTSATGTTDTDITDQLVDIFNTTYSSSSLYVPSKSGHYLVYIPSGRYYVGDDNNLVIHSNTYFVLEDDTELIKKDNTSNSLLRTRESDNSSNITIYGGTFNGNRSGKHVLEMMRAKNITIENTKIKNSAKGNHGIYVNNSTVNIKNANVFNNSNYGLYLRETGSSVTIKNSNIYNNEYGIYVAAGAKLYANDSANNRIYDNDVNGVSVNGTASNGTKSEAYLHKNVITGNGKAKKQGSDGVMGHGIGVTEGAYANITNNEICNNYQCGISVFKSSRAKINKNIINGNGRHGIGAREKTNLAIAENTINNNSYNGVLIADRSDATMEKNTITSSKKFGLSLTDNSTAKLTGNSFNNSTDSNISVSGKESTLTLTKNNSVLKSKKNGINLSGYAILKITGVNNLINNNTAYGISLTSTNATLKITGDGTQLNKNGKSGFYTSGAKTIKITGKTAFKENTKSGIVVYGAKATISNADIYKNGEFGLSVRNKANVTITNSVVKKNKCYGIHVVDSGSKATIEKNKINNNKNAGINIDKKARVYSIYKNKLEKNGDKAIRIAGSAKVDKIKKNTIKKHNVYGIYIKGAKVGTISGNSFSGITKKRRIYRA